MKKEMEPLVVTILPTRKCPLRCSYCKIQDQCFPNELNWRQWVEALVKINRQFPSICFNVLLGGDITVWGKDLVKFVREMKETGISYGFTTNGVLLNRPYLEDLKEAGLESISLSLDTLVSREDCSEDGKSYRTVRLLPILNEMGFKDLHCTITVDNTNLEEVPSMIEFLTKHNTYAEITPMLFGKTKAYDYTSSYEELKDRLFTEEDTFRIHETTKKIVDMKKQGYLVHNTDVYLLGWSSTGIDQNWMCGYPVGLVADADGSMRLCLQIRGDKVTKHNIRNLDFETFLGDWNEDYHDLCCGCYWNCHYEADYLYKKTGSIVAVRDYYNHNVKRPEQLLGERNEKPEYVKRLEKLYEKALEQKEMGLALEVLEKLRQTNRHI